MFKGLFWYLLLGAIILCVSYAVGHAEETGTFSWLSNQETNLAGYKIHSGKATRNYNQIHDVGLPEIVGGRVQSTIFVTPGKNYFAATAYDTEGLESDFSEEVIATWLPAPIIEQIEFN